MLTVTFQSELFSPNLISLEFNSPLFLFSTCEAELNSLDEGAKQACYLCGLLSELGFGQEGPMALYNNNQSAIALANRSAGGKLRHSRHLEIKIHA